MTVSRRSSGLLLEDRSSLTAAPTELVDRSRFRNDGAYVNMNTAVQLPKGLYAHSFNGTTSKINCGSDFIQVTATIEVWINPNTWGSGASSIRIIDNGQLILLSMDTLALQFTSDAYGSDAVSANNAITLNQWQLISVTRTATGVVNIYVNGVLSGVADQASGTPIVGTTNIFIGNNNGGTRGFGGYLALPHIYNYALNAGQIEKIYSSQRGFFRV